MKPVVIVSVIVGILLVVAAIIYFITPANSLPHFFPGYSASLTKHHITHAVGTLILGIAAFIFAWFQSGKKTSRTK